MTQDRRLDRSVALLSFLAFLACHSTSRFPLTGPFGAFGPVGYVLMSGPGHVARCGGLGPFFGRSLGAEAEAERCLGQTLCT